MNTNLTYKELFKQKFSFLLDVFSCTVVGTEQIERWFNQDSYFFPHKATKKQAKEANKMSNFND